MASTETLPVLLKQLRLSTIARLWEPLLSRAQEEHWNPAQYLATLCEQEVNERYSRRIARFTKESRLPMGKTLETFNFNHTPAIRQEKIDALAQNSDWVKRAENLLFFGPSGVGKTHLAAAISHALIEQSIRVRHFTTTALVQKMQQARADLQLESFLSKLDKYAVIVLDDLGYVKKSDAETHVLFELIAHRYETGSMIITSNQPFGEWDKIFTDPSMTVAAIDRVVHHSIIIEIQADSHRKRQAISRNIRIPLKPEPTQEDNNKTKER
ncbi:MAG TPA: IS21-like element helper ATPase IstB [Desulfobacter sp.]|nr:IS21-like element helper ATPase IstB [Desulfobacter sp.]